MCKKVLSRITGLLLTAFLLAAGVVPAFAQTERKVSVDVKDVKLEQVMRQIEKQTGCVFLNKDADVEQKVSVTISDKPLDEALNILFSGRDIDWKVESGHIIISQRAVSAPGGQKAPVHPQSPDLSSMRRDCRSSESGS